MPEKKFCFGSLLHINIFFWRKTIVAAIKRHVSERRQIPGKKGSLLAIKQIFSGKSGYGGGKQADATGSLSQVFWEIEREGRGEKRGKQQEEEK